MTDGKKAVMTIRLTREQKIRYVWQAKAEGKKLEEFVIELLDAYCAEKGTAEPDKK